MPLISSKIFFLPNKYRSLMLDYQGLTKNFIMNSKDKFSKRNLLNTLGVACQIQNKQSIRTFSNVNYQHFVPPRGITPKDENQEFMSIFPDFVREVDDFFLLQTEQTRSVSDVLSKALYYNIPKGKKNRGMLIVMSYKELVNKNNLTKENIRLAQYLGWCVELLQGTLCVLDDIMDRSDFRRGQPCWHKLEAVGDKIAINHGLMMEGALYYILKKQFGDKSYYLNMIELFHEVIFISSVGQTLDWQMSCDKNLLNFSMEKYMTIADGKTIYTIYFPLALAMHMAGFEDPEAFNEAKEIVSGIGRFYQIQDDFIDCFGDPNVTGKIGSDIQNRKCSWLAVVCLQRCNEAQKKIMLECYGHNDPGKVERVKELYQELEIPKIYANYEEDLYNLTKTHIQQASHYVPRQTYMKILDKLFQRRS